MRMMEDCCAPYFDPEFETLVERIYSPRVCIDNETCEDSTLVKVDSANRHGILLEMVQVLTDLDLIISKSYITSDGGWLMDVFHVTDQLGNKLTDPSLIHFIQQSLVNGRRSQGLQCNEVRTCLGNLVGPSYRPSEYTFLEISVADQPGLLSEISAVLVELDCRIVTFQAWTHNSHAAIIMCLVDETSNEPIFDTARLAHIEEQVGTVIGAHNAASIHGLVKVSAPDPGRIHTERRLHQLMREDRDYEEGPAPVPVDDGNQLTFASMARKSDNNDSRTSTQVSIESWKEKGYAVVIIRCTDRPRLFFDTVCTLTDMEYVVFHAAVLSHGSLAIQEYYIRHIDGCTLDSEVERRRVTRCLVAAVERRVSHGVKLDMSMRDRSGLLSDITRSLRENGMTVVRAECTTRGEKAVGSFYVRDSSGGDVSLRRVEYVRQEIGIEGLKVNDNSQGWPLMKNTSHTGGQTENSKVEERPRFSLGSIFWSQIGRLSGNLGSIGS